MYIYWIVKEINWTTVKLQRFEQSQETLIQFKQKGFSIYFSL